MASTVSLGTPSRITLGLANIATQVILTNARRVSVRFITNDGKYSNTGTDGAAIGTAYATLDADMWHEILVDRQSHGHQPSIYLASATGSTVVEVLTEVR